MSLRQNLYGIFDILVGIAVDDERKASASVGYGLTLARTAGAHLTVQSASWHLAGDDLWLGAFDDGSMAAAFRKLDALADVAAEKAAGDAAMAGVVCTTETPRLTYPQVVDRLVRRSRLFDLTVLDTTPATFDLDHEMIEKVLFGGGRPVVVVPPSVSSFSSRKIVIGWDGSAEAARAVNDAMPFLRYAEAVELVCAVGKDELPGTIAGSEIAPHLVRHGVDVTVHEVAIQGHAVDTLRSAVACMEADMLVLGGYHHTPRSERMFGGVTRSLLRNPPVPLFMSR